MKNKKVLTLLSLLILVGCSEGPPAKKSLPSYNNTSARNQIGYGDSSQRNDQTKTEASKKASISESSPAAPQPAETTPEPQNESLSSPIPENEKEEESKESATSPWWLSLVAPSTLKQIVPVVSFGTFKDINDKLQKKFVDDTSGKKDEEDATCSAKLKGLNVKWKWKNVQEKGKKANERSGEVAAMLKDGEEQAEERKVRDAITDELLNNENPADRYRQAQELLRYRNNGPRSLLPHPQTSR